VSPASRCPGSAGGRAAELERTRALRRFSSLASTFLILAGWLITGIPGLADGTNNVSTNEFVSDLPGAWLREFVVRGSVGYKDNLLLDRSAREHSLSLGSGADITVARLPVDGVQFNFLLSFDDTRFPDGDTVDHEDLLFALAQFKVDTSAHWRFGMDTRYIYQDQVLDTSVTETNLEASPVLGHSVAIVPNVRWMPGGNLWVELSGIAQRSLYRAPLDDYWEGGPKLMLGNDYGHRSSISAGYGLNQRAYETREQLTLDQTPIPGTSLQFRQHDFEVAWRHNWDPDHHWRTASRVGLQFSRDNGPGFYNYNRWYAAQQLRYATAAWEVRLQGKFSFYVFPHQEADGASEDRQKTLVGADLRAERRLWRGLKLFASYEYEQSIANRTLDEYQVNTVVGGASWEF